MEKNILKAVIVGIGIMMLSSCNGIFDGIYDQPDPIIPTKGQLVIDATSWTNWYYVDLPTLHQLAEGGDGEALQKAQTEFAAYPIPMEATGEIDKTEAGHAAATSEKKSGQYTYWFDVFGEGIGKSEFRSYTPTEPQTAPKSWSFAVHRNNVRTNGGAVLKTSFTSMDDIPDTSEPFHDMEFTEDEWTENEIWDSQDQLRLCLVPSQGIEVNKLLSSWLVMKLPPIPPAFVHDNHVFVLRLKDGTYAALQLENYLSSTGTKCWLTINYKYPY